MLEIFESFFSYFCIMFSLTFMCLVYFYLRTVLVLLHYTDCADLERLNSLAWNRLHCKAKLWLCNTIDSRLIESCYSHFRSVKLGMKEQAMICYGKGNVKSVVLVRLFLSFLYFHVCSSDSKTAFSV